MRYPNHKFEGRKISGEAKKCRDNSELGSILFGERHTHACSPSQLPAALRAFLLALVADFDSLDFFLPFDSLEAVTAASGSIFFLERLLVLLLS